MSDAKDQHEPSMEEILASIRRIISEDGDPAAAVAQAPAPQPAAAGADDVLVLTEEVEDEPAEPHLTVPPSAPEPAAPQPRAAEEPQVKLAEPEPEPVAPAAAAQFGRRLISEGAANASLAALSELVNRTQRDPAIESLPMGQSNRTLEDLTRELLRPMLKAWLDENLPPLVERIVREEIGRLALDAQRR